ATAVRRAWPSALWSAASSAGARATTTSDSSGERGGAAAAWLPSTVGPEPRCRGSATLGAPARTSPGSRVMGKCVVAALTGNLLGGQGAPPQPRPLTRSG